MSRDDRVPAPLEALIRAVAGRPDDDDQRASTFARGVAIGALVGAAIAGSTIWQRRHATPRTSQAEPSKPSATPSAHG